MLELLKCNLMSYNHIELLDMFDRALRYEYRFIRKVNNVTIKYSPYTFTPTHILYISCHIKPHKSYEYSILEYLYTLTTFMGIGEGLIFRLEYE